MMRNRAPEPDLVLTLDAGQEHALRNHFAVILGFCEAMKQDFAPSDPAIADIDEIHQAARAALAIIAEARKVDLQTARRSS